MKGKRVQTHGLLSAKASAVRIGGDAWISCLSSEGLPGKDFVMRAPNANWSGFKDRIADFYDAQAALRALLVISGMELREAMTYSCHSFRHLYPTAGKQLDLNADNIEAMGRWKPGGGMPELYDSRACVSELLQKSKVIAAVTSGWELAAPGCIPAKPPPATAPPRRQPRPVGPRVQAQGLVCYVLHTGKSKLHGYTGGPYSLCRQWRCGERDSPSMDALFVPFDETSLIHFEVCRSCASQHKCTFPQGGEPANKGSSSPPRAFSSSMASSASSASF